MNNTFIYRSNGTYVGFIQNDSFYSRDGKYEGWVEGNYVWDINGRYRGSVTYFNGHYYIWLNMFVMQPVTRSPKIPLPSVIPSTPPAPIISPTSLPIGFVDSF